MTGPDIAPVDGPIAPVDGPFLSKNIAVVDGPFSSKPKSLFQQKEAAVEPPLIIDELAREAAREAVEAEYEARWMKRVQTELGKIVASGLSDARSAKDREHQVAIDKLGAQVEAGIKALEAHQREAEAKLKKKEAEWRAQVAKMREAEEGSKQEYRKRAANMSEALREKSKALEELREKSGSSYLESEVKRWRDRAVRAEESLRNRGEVGFRRKEQTGSKRDRERSPNHERGGRGAEPASKKDYSPAGGKPRSSRSQSSDLTGDSGSRGKGGGEGERPKGESGPDWRTYAERRPAYLLNLKTIVREPSEELLASRKKTAEDKARLSERFRADIEAFDKKAKELEEDAERERAGQEERIREQAKAAMVDDNDDQEPMVLTQAQGGKHATRTEIAWDEDVDDDEDWNIGELHRAGFIQVPITTKEVLDDDDDIREHGDLPTAAQALQAKRGEKGARGTAGLGPDNPQDSPVRELGSVRGGTTSSAAAKTPTATAYSRTKTKDLVDAVKEAAAEGGSLPGLVSGKSLRKGKVTHAISFIMDLCRSPPGEVVTGADEDEVDYEEEEVAPEGEVNADETAPAVVPKEPAAATQVETTEELLARLAAEKKKAGSLKYQKAKMAKAARLAAANPTPAEEELDTSQTSIDVFMGTGTAAPGDEDPEEEDEGEEGEESGGDNPGKRA
jgi:hypothetical protein